MDGGGAIQALRNCQGGLGGHPGRAPLGSGLLGGWMPHAGTPLRLAQTVVYTVKLMVIDYADVNVDVT